MMKATQCSKRRDSGQGLTTMVWQRELPIREMVITTPAPRQLITSTKDGGK